jgi:NAD(P)-dependent dehydrogenase (short-subunit alcohol dehydrogenase family)
VSTVSADLADYEETRHVAEAALALAPIDILINNAGHIVRRVHWTDLGNIWIASSG